MNRHVFTPLRIAILIVLCATVGALAQDDAPRRQPGQPRQGDRQLQSAPLTVKLPQSWVDALQWRSIGPGNMGGRITDIAVDPTRTSRYWVATAGGGLLVTEDNGVTFSHQFDHEAVAAIGAVAVSPSNPQIVWVGTGEANPRNSVSYGNGVYKSEDGGKTWAHSGLDKSFQIGEILIDAENPDVVLVGALGRLWGESEERGLYRTEDGGKTWSKVLHVDTRTGVVDLKAQPDNKQVILAATWERQRDLFDTNDPAKRHGPGSGLWRSTDGGKTFSQITAGLPSEELGRIGVDFCQDQPDIVYAVVDSKTIGEYPADSPFIGITGQDAEVGARITSVGKETPAEKAGLQKDDIVVEMDGEIVHSYAQLVGLIRAHKANDTIKLVISRKRETTRMDLTLGQRPDPEDGQTRRDNSPFAADLGGQRPNLQDQQGPDGHNFGGIYKSTDAGLSWTRVNSLNPRPMYYSELRVAPDNPDVIWVLGTLLWRSDDGGKTFAEVQPDDVHVDHHAMWIDPADSNHVRLGNDGGFYETYDRGEHWMHHNRVAIGQFYHVGVGPRRDYRVFGGLQDNGSWGGPSVVRNGSGPANTDWFRVGGGDGFRCLVDPDDHNQIYFESQNGGIGRRHLETGERGYMGPRAPRGTEYRFNWNTPFVLSHFNSRIYYVAGNYVFRSLMKGNGLQRISPQISLTDKGAATALSESPRNAAIMFVGTDDGALWRTTDGGATWEDVFNLPDETQTQPENGEGEGDEPEVDPEDVQRTRQNIMRYDANGDSQLSAEELPDRLRRSLEASDANKTGMLEGDEITHFATEWVKGRIRAEDAARGRESEPTPDGKKLAELVPDRRRVAWIETSRVRSGRVYLVLDGHYADDDRAHLFVSEDTGRTWRSLVSDLPAAAGTTRVLIEDTANENLLFLGTEFGAWCSLDRGLHWQKLGGNLPTVAVHGFAISDAAEEIVAATHGRSLWVLDLKTLRQISRETLAATSHLFQPRAAVIWRPQPERGDARGFVGQNPPDGAQIVYSLANEVEAASISLRIETLDGKELHSVEKPPAAAGLHVVEWNLRRKPDNPRARSGPRVEPGLYRVRLTIGETVHVRDLQVTGDPGWASNAWIDAENEADELEAEHGDEEEREREGAAGASHVRD